MTGLLAGCSRREDAPAFAFTRLDGTPAHSRDLRGHVVLVNFWATSCAVCVAEMPSLVDTHQRFQGRGLKLLAVAMQHDPPARVIRFAEDRQLPFDVVIDNTGAIARSFDDVSVTPSWFLIDRRGRVSRRWVGAPDFSALDGWIEALLVEA